MSEHSITVRLRINTQKIREELEEIIHPIKGFHIQLRDSQSCDLLIMEMGDEPEKDFELVKEIQNSKIAGEVFLTSRNTNPEILLKALRTGVKEFFPQPIQKEEVTNALSRFKGQFVEARVPKESTAKEGKIINVMGSKGGVGTTTVAVNLATCLIKAEGIRSVALIDMNHNFGEVPVFLGIKTSFDWTNIAKDISRLDATYLESILFRHSSGIQVLSSSAKVIDEHVITSQAINTLLKLMRTMFDFIIIDSGQCSNGINKDVLKTSDTILLVSVSSLPCLINAKKVISTFHNLGYPAEQNIHLLMNRFQKDSFITLKEAEESINKKFLCCIPNDYQMTMSAINQGKPLAALNNKARISKSFMDLSAIITGKKSKKKKGIFGLKLLILS
ncbi:MAG: AAA family ATPase [bacterium]